MTASQLALLCAGMFFLLGLLTGAWKHHCIVRSPDARAPVYVDIAHRTSLMYSFACVLLAQLARHSAWSNAVNTAAIIVLVVWFGAAVASYLIHGVLRDTDNQFRKPHKLGSRTLPGWRIQVFMVGLTVGEVGGFLVLLSGFVVGLD